MQKTRQKIIRLLKTNGGLTTKELSATVGISATAVRRHLKTLEAKDIVCHETAQRGMGRPSFVYKLINNLCPVFRRSYNAFATSIIHELTELETGGRSEALIQERVQKRQQKYIDRIGGETLGERVASLARLMEYEGRMTTWQQINAERFVLREHNCPFRQLTRELDHLCRFEVAFLQQALRAQVARVNHILEGDISCVYEIHDHDDGDVSAGENV